MGIQICVFEKIQLEMIQIGVEFGAAAVHPPARVNLSLPPLEETGPKLDSASSSWMGLCVVNEEETMLWNVEAYQISKGHHKVIYTFVGVKIQGLVIYWLTKLTNMNQTTPVVHGWLTKC